MKCRVRSTLLIAACLVLPGCADSPKKEDRGTVVKPQLDGLSDEEFIVRSASVSDTTVKQWLRHTP
jgi:hypothetical protein